ncbi:NRDE family protein [bacterium]|nr:NRDE family protein [bacterium]
MCLIAFAWKPDADYRLVVAANRDEFHARPTAPLGWWDDDPEVAAGRDLQAGGSWMGCARGGRFAALTNFREMQQTPVGAPSRGELVANFLRGNMTPEQFMHGIDGKAYAGFSLLLSDGDSLWFGSNRPKPHAHAVEAGVYALSNGELDSGWPKVERARARLEGLLAGGSVKHDALLALMHHTQPGSDAHLPDTGVGTQTERFLSPMFITGDAYGTRASTALTWTADGDMRITERRFDADGVAVGEDSLAL